MTVILTKDKIEKLKIFPFGPRTILFTDLFIINLEKKEMSFGKE